MESIFLLRLSEELTKPWKGILLAASVNQTPTLNQHVTTLMFNGKISEVVKAESRSSHDMEPLTDNEGNALCCTAGYICCQLRKHLGWSDDEVKEQLILCLMEMTTSKDSDILNTNEEWTF